MASGWGEAVSYVRYLGGRVHKTGTGGPEHSSGCIFMHHHKMLWSLTWRAGSQKALSGLSEGYSCRILDMNFREFLFHELQ